MGAKEEEKKEADSNIRILLSMVVSHSMSR